jgi:hypothetical protein
LPDSRLTYGSKVVSLRTGCALLRINFFFSVFGTHFCYRLSEPQGLVRSEGLGKLEKMVHVIWSGTHYLPACTLLSQPLRYLNAEEFALNFIQDV